MSYQYLVHRNLSKKQVIERYEAFTYPSFLQKSKVRRNLREPFLVIEVLYQQERVALSVLELLSEKSLLKILSLFVKEDFRKKGIATQMLKISEKIAANHQLSFMSIIFQNNWESFTIMPRLLKNLGWQPPQKSMILVKVSYNQIKNLPSFQIRDYPEWFSVKPWSSLSQEEYDYIEQKQAQEQWYSRSLSPFQLPDLLVKEGSLALFYKQEIIGWLITHYSTVSKTVQITSYFIDPKHRKTKASIAIVSNTIKAIYEKGIAEQFLFMFETTNQDMRSLSKKIAGEYNTGAFTEVWVSQKRVAEGV